MKALVVFLRALLLTVAAAELAVFAWGLSELVRQPTGFTAGEWLLLFHSVALAVGSVWIFLLTRWWADYV